MGEDTEEEKTQTVDGYITFPVPFQTIEVEENMTVNTNINSQISKDPIINKINFLISDGNIAEAYKYYKYLIDSGFNNPNIVCDYSEILIDLGKFYKAENKLREIIKLNPRMLSAYNNLARVLLKLGKNEEGKLISEKAFRINPNSADTLNILGTILANEGKLNNGVNCILNAIRINPNLSKPYINLGLILNAIGKPEEAIIQFKKALDLDPNNSIYICELIYILSKLSELDKTKVYFSCLKNLEPKGRAIDPFKLLHLEDDPSKDLKRSINFYNCNYNFISKDFIKTKKDFNKEKINIAYVSADFKDHPVINILAETFLLHDKSKFNIYIYSFGPIDDNFKESLKKNGCNFLDIKDLNIEDTVKIIRNDKIDIAIDLMGYTKNNRMSIFSYKIAPIQINYLGYPSTSGAKTIDYLIADKVIIPLEKQKYYSEKIIYMPNCYMPYNNKTKISNRVFSRNEFKLKADAFVLAAFHSIQKVTLKEIDSWSRILTNIDNAILWISYTNKTAEKNIKNQFIKRGIDERKIIFSKKINSRKEHLSRHSCADLFIDSFNYNGHSTTIDSLWTGLPVVTLLGKSFSARVSASFLKTLGFEELIAYNIDEYEKIIINLASNPKKLKNISDKIKQEKKLNPLFDSRKSTKDLEEIFYGLINGLRSN